MSMNKLVDCVRRLVTAGYRQDKAVLAVYQAWALTPEQVAELARKLAA